MEQKIFQMPLPHAEYTVSDTECLTLNISVPLVDSPVGLPVFAFVHGGGFTTGSSSFPQYDLARLTSMSVKIGKPMIAVGIKYVNCEKGVVFV